MIPYLIDAVLKRDNGSELCVEVHFDYILPLYYQGQGGSHGSIQLVVIKEKVTNERIIDLSLDEHIQLKRICWIFLEGLQ